MALRITEFFGHPPGSPQGAKNAANNFCPFVLNACIKPNHGSCSLEALQDSEPVICCPNRLYASNFAILGQVSEIAFGIGTNATKPSELKLKGFAGPLNGNEVAVFGKYWGGELPLPKALAGTGSYYVDWILAKVDTSGKASEITALEVQTIDTTGSYIDQSNAYFGDRRKIGGQAASAIGAYGSLAGWNFCPKPEPSVPL